MIKKNFVFTIILRNSLENLQMKKKLKNSATLCSIIEMSNHAFSETVGNKDICLESHAYYLEDSGHF